MYLTWKIMMFKLKCLGNDLRVSNSKSAIKCIIVFNMICNDMGKKYI